MPNASAELSSEAGRAGGAMAGDLLPVSFDHSSAEEEIVSLAAREHTFAIRTADSDGQRSNASILINQMYGWRGYGSGFTVEDGTGQITLVASDRATGAAFGTITVALEGKDGLLADRLYHEEIERLRTEGRQLCEMIKFAVDKAVRSKRLLSALFHIAFIYAYHLQKRTDLLIEVTPQHAVFYRHVLHFEPFGPEKLNPRVNTRGVLLRLNLDHAAEQIRLLGGQGKSSKDKSLYPYAFSAKEEAGIVERLRNLESGS